MDNNGNICHCLAGEDNEPYKQVEHKGVPFGGEGSGMAAGEYNIKDANR